MVALHSRAAEMKSAADERAADEKAEAAEAAALRGKGGKGKAAKKGQGSPDPEADNSPRSNMSSPWGTDVRDPQSLDPQSLARITISRFHQQQRRMHQQYGGADWHSLLHAIALWW